MITVKKIVAGCLVAAAFAVGARVVARSIVDGIDLEEKTAASIKANHERFLAGQTVLTRANAADGGYETLGLYHAPTGHYFVTRFNSNAWRETLTVCPILYDKGQYLGEGSGTRRQYVAMDGNKLTEHAVLADGAFEDTIVISRMYMGLWNGIKRTHISASEASYETSAIKTECAAAQRDFQTFLNRTNGSAPDALKR